MLLRSARRLETVTGSAGGRIALHTTGYRGIPALRLKFAETYGDGRLHSDRMAISRARTKPPFTYRFDSLPIQAEATWGLQVNVLYLSRCIYDYIQGDGSPVMRLPGPFG